jgi:hypothetical protein
MRSHLVVALVAAVVVSSPLGCVKTELPTDGGSGGGGTDTGGGGGTDASATTKADASTASGADASSTAGADASTLPSDGGVIPGTVQDYVNACQQVLGHYCDYFVRCKLMDSAQLDDCKAFFFEVCASESGKASIRGGKRIFDKTKLQGCLDLIKVAGCGSASPFEDPNNKTCEEVVLPTVAVGGTCFGSEDCKDKNKISCLKKGCTGTCELSSSQRAGGAKVGEPCDSRTGVFCDSATGYCKPNPTDAGFASAGTCAAFLKDGESCDFGKGECDPRTSFCDYSGTKKCTPRAGLGAACSGYSDCQENLFCNHPSSGTAGKCEARFKDGAACDPKNFGQCEPKLQCNDLTQKCESYERKLGQSCTDHQYCARSYCKGMTSTATGTCVALEPVGAKCDPMARNRQCEEGSACEAHSATCMSFSGAGGPCVDLRCKLLLRCASGTCAALGKLGDACDPKANGDVCVAGALCDPATSKCVGPRAAGAACTSSRECASQECTRSGCAPVCNY